MANLVKVQIPEKPTLPFEGGPMDLDFRQFIDYAGGQLAQALFKGQFESTLYMMINLAHARGKAEYHRELMLQANK